MSSCRTGIYGTPITALLGAALVVSMGCDDADCQAVFAGDGYRGLEIASPELRNPDSGQCEPFYTGGGGGCDACGSCYDAPTGAESPPPPDWAQCYGACESLDESACLAASGCRAAYVGGAFFQCWGTAPSGPTQGGDCSALGAYECSRHDDCVAHHAAGAPGMFQSCAAESSTSDPGSCVGEVACDALPPACPEGTIAGRRDACWTGYCIPLAQCDAVPACSDLDEPMCIGRSDCSPVYEGQNCSCMGGACTCQSWLFETCDAG